MSEIVDMILRELVDVVQALVFEMHETRKEIAAIASTVKSIAESTKNPGPRIKGRR